MKKFGIRGRLPPGDPMRAEHLLGDNWEWTRWYEDEVMRDAALVELNNPFTYYRRGDRPSLVLSKIEQNL
jgi:hypothetical protein